jgi:hypothetical protein
MRSQTNVATKNAIGKGISMGWIGCPKKLAELTGFAMVNLLSVASAF